MDVAEDVTGMVQISSEGVPALGVLQVLGAHVFAVEFLIQELLAARVISHGQTWRERAYRDGLEKAKQSSSEKMQTVLNEVLESFGEIN